jgi:hypothetical protein
MHSETRRIHQKAILQEKVRRIFVREPVGHRAIDDWAHLQQCVKADERSEHRWQRVGESQFFDAASDPFEVQQLGHSLSRR